MKKNNKNIVAQGLAFASQMVPAIIGVLAFMLLVRTIESSILGQYVIYMAAVVLFEMIKSGGLQSALVMKLTHNDEQQQLKTIGGAYWLGGIVSLSLSIVLLIIYFSGLFKNQTGIQIFCGWYAVLGIITLPLHIAEAEAVARQDLKFLFWLRTLQSTNTVLIAVYCYFMESSLKSMATIHLAFTFFLLLIVIFLRKSNPLHIKHKTTEEVKSLFGLTKYSLATLAVTNLLKTADTFLIGSLMGPVAVAKYAVPLKLTELFEMPLRSLSTTAFPQLAAKNNSKEYSLFKKIFIQYLSWAYLLYIPALLICFILAPYIVVVLGGHQYEDTSAIFRVFILFGLFLPANRMTGIGLDALHMPDKNFQKVLIMAIINILGDFIAIKMTHQLEWVAFVSVLNAATGAMLGWWLLERTGIIKQRNILNDISSYSITFMKQALKRIR